ncbi:M20 family metallopeptidase [Curtobacterium pusillum]|uniref:Peptidase M20 domain-containing protein 2 n=1 Tax=Curtobacterium pusillum TaxID=69373 RepID=A0ABX2M6T3_9MICO|nr:M20 family metallopeptidase [Curtobacterium pusillum]NUU13660.1 M20 family metallopeptidase [Curtobacterium pusillum]GLK30756.1 amidase [Curtobacterium pusillum]
MTVTAPIALTDRVEAAVRARSEQLLRVSHAVHADPETAFEEHHAAELLASEAERAGFAVERGAYGLPTAFEAVAGTGPFRVVVCAEYDALPGIGHACGHNVIATAGLGAALALAEVADEAGLTVVLLGTPAEEHGGGKAILLERGAWEGATISLMAHGTAAAEDVACSLVGTQAVDRFDVTFTGRVAHAAAAPHEAVNAADAATLALSAIGLLRQQLVDGIRVAAFVEHGGDATNIVPGMTRVRAEVRAHELDVMLDAKRRVLACFEGAAIATGCTWESERAEPRYDELRQDPTLAALWDDALRALGRTVAGGGERVGGSTDMGNVSQVVPSIHPMIALLGAVGVAHTPAFAADAGGPAGDVAALDAAIGLARTVVAAATGPAAEAFLQAARTRTPGATTHARGDA